MRAHTIETCRERAAKRGGVCLSRHYTNGRTHLSWRCRELHEWSATWANVSRGTWCPICANKSPLSIEDMHKAAMARGGSCLSTAFTNTRQVLRWRCARGHVWQAKAGAVLEGTWCPHCAQRAPWTDAALAHAARRRGGKYLGQVDERAHRWRCALGHEWIAGTAVARGRTWCPTCAGTRRLTIDDLRDVARERGGACLAEICSGSQVKVEWQCARGHRWWATPNQIRTGSWCPTCARERLRGPRLRRSLADMHRLAHARGGRCLSGAYAGDDTKLLWQCAERHRWWSRPRTVARSWCPRCAGAPRYTVEDMQVLAAKHAGQCLSTTYAGVGTKLRWRCAVGHEFRATPADLRRSKSFCPECRSVKPGTLAEMQAIARSRGGKCLSRRYVNSYSHLAWACARGHRWRAVPYSVKRGRWCARCARS
jgi:hypothetical protein